MILFDTHCHPQLMREDLAFTKGLTRAIAVSVNLADRSILTELCSKFRTNLYYTVGSHPLSPDCILDDPIDVSWLCDPYCVALGETGLDYFPDITELQKRQQLQKLDYHLTLARNLNKVVILHTRYRVGPDLIALLRRYPSVRCVFHSFCNTIDLMKQCLALGHYISFSGIVTFSNTPHVKKLASLVPDDRILIETDSPFLTPVPYRGHDNHPRNVRLIAETLAQIRHTSYEAICYLTYRNASQVFLNE